MKENNRTSEQAFNVQVSLEEPPTGVVKAINMNDFSLFAGRGLYFGPELEFHQLTFTIFGDDLTEGNEGFNLSSGPMVGFAQYTTPLLGSSATFRTTTIIIEDDGSEL